MRFKMHVKVGCDAEGHITAVRTGSIGDKGAYASVGAKVLERAAGHACGPYRVPAIDIEALAVYTNNPPCGAMRGFGANQSAFAIEQLLDRLAKKVGIDGWEIRWRNILQQGDRFATGQKLDKPFGLKETLLAVKDAYRGAKYAGIACGIKNCGIGNGMPDPGKARRCGSSRTAKSAFAPATPKWARGCSPSRFKPPWKKPACRRKHSPRLTDTAVDLDCGQTTGSRGTMLSCNAVIDAAKKLKADLDSGKSLKDLIGREYRGEWICNYTHKLGAHVDEPKTHLTYGFATQVVILDDDGKIQESDCRARRRQGDESNALQRADGRLDPHGFGLRPDRRFRRRRRADCDRHDQIDPRAAGASDARAGIDVRRNGRSGMSVRGARRGRAGLGADGAGRGGCAASVRRHRADRAADERFAGGKAILTPGKAKPGAKRRRVFNRSGTRNLSVCSLLLHWVETRSVRRDRKAIFRSSMQRRALQFGRWPI